MASNVPHQYRANCALWALTAISVTYSTSLFRPQTARHRIQHVGDFVDPATLLASFRGRPHIKYPRSRAHCRRTVRSISDADDNPRRLRCPPRHKMPVSLPLFVQQRKYSGPRAAWHFQIQTFRPHRASNRLDGSPRSESGKPARHVGAIAFILGSEALAERRLLKGNYDNVKKEPEQRAVAEESPVSE